MLVLYFHSQNALFELLDGILLFYFRYRDMARLPLILHAWLPLRAIYSGFRMMILPIALGSGMVFYFYFWRRSLHNSLKDMLTKDEFSAILLSFPLFVAWSALDFQNAYDFFVFIPYIAIGFARFLDIAALIGSAVLDIRFNSESGYLEQRDAAIEIERRYGMDIKLAAIGAPEVLVILHRANPTPYVLITTGIDHRIHATTLGGFKGWIMELEAYDPDVIAFGPTHGRHVPKLMKWLNTRYDEEQIGPWKLFVKNSPV